MKRVKSRELRLKRISNLKLFLIFIIGLIVLGCNKGNVKAGMNDSVIVKNRIDGIYAVAEIDGNPRIFYLNTYYMNGVLAYCIELGVDITSSLYHSTSDFSISYLSDEEIDYVRTITRFGYLYENDYLYYAAMQEIIWEYISGVDVYWINSLNVNGEKINIDNYKNEIFDLVNEYNSDLELDINDEYMIGENIIINNDDLDKYEVLSSLYSDVLIEGDRLVIDVGNIVGSEEIVLKRKNSYGYDSKLYYYDDSQKLISVGDYPEDIKVINFDIRGVSLVGQVMEGVAGGINPINDSLEGAIYEVYDEFDNLIGSYDSDKNGYFLIDNLVYGKYYFKQVSPSLGYVVNDDIVEVVVDRDGIVVNLEQELITNTIVINKVYGSTDLYKPEKGITFIAFNENRVSAASAVTNSEGVAKFILPYGKYTISQVATTPGYSMADKFSVDVISNSEDEFYYNLINEFELVNVRISTFDDNNKELLKSSDIAYKVKDVKLGKYLEFQGKDTFYSDLNGVVFLPMKLDYGNYVLEQVLVPNGFMLLDDLYSFKINTSSKFKYVNGVLVMDVFIYNKEIKGSVNIQSLQEVYYKSVNEFGYKESVRENVSFSLVASEDIILNNKVKYMAGEEVYLGNTDMNGNLIISNLYFGKYCLVDKETLEEKCFEIEKDNQEISLKFIKYIDKGNLVIVNKSTDGDIISDSIFEVVDSDNVVIYTGITNTGGVVNVNNLFWGNYCVRQKDINDAYYLYEEEECFSLEGDKEILFLNDQVVHDVIMVPDTLSINDFGFYEIIIMLSLIGTCYVVYKKIFSNK